MSTCFGLPVRKIHSLLDLHAQRALDGSRDDTVGGDIVGDSRDVGVLGGSEACKLASHCSVAA